MNLKPHPSGFFAAMLKRAVADAEQIMQEYEAKQALERPIIPPMEPKKQ